MENCNCNYHPKVSGSVVRGSEVPPDLTCVNSASNSCTSLLDKVINLYATSVRGDEFAYDARAYLAITGDMLEWYGGKETGACGNLAQGFSFAGSELVGERIHVTITPSEFEVVSKAYQNDNEGDSWVYKVHLTFDVRVETEVGEHLKGEGFVPNLMVRTCLDITP